MHACHGLVGWVIQVTIDLVCFGMALLYLISKRLIPILALPWENSSPAAYGLLMAGGIVAWGAAPIIWLSSSRAFLIERGWSTHDAVLAMRLGDILYWAMRWTMFVRLVSMRTALSIAIAYSIELLLALGLIICEVCYSVALCICKQPIAP